MQPYERILRIRKWSTGIGVVFILIRFIHLVGLLPD